MTGPLEDPSKWAKAIRDLGALGALIAIALYMAYRFLNGVPTSADIGEIKSTLEKHVNTTNLYLYAVCRHTAKTQDERDDCPPPR